MRGAWLTDSPEAVPGKSLGARGGGREFQPSYPELGGGWEGKLSPGAVPGKLVRAGGAGRESAEVGIDSEK